MEWILGIFGSAIVAFLTAHFEMARLREANKLDFSTEQAIRTLLSQEGWTLRSFSQIKHHIRGYEDEELRKQLVRAGALAFTDLQDNEMWGLLEFNLDSLQKSPVGQV